MKHVLIGTCVALGLLTACQAPAGGGVSKADFDAVKTDVDKLKLDIYGDPKAKCPTEKWLDLAAYGEDTAPAAMDDFAAWHAENGKRTEITTTKSGLQYMVIQDGQDGPMPVGSQPVKVNYHGYFPNGEKFDSSYDRGQPIDFPANGVITGWVEALAGMTPCEARRLYIPGDLAYGPKGRGGIPANATLVFNVQLLEIGK